jgi:serine/threonine-protein kinase HipA
MATSFKPVNAIEVKAWGRRVGAVALEPTTGFYAFEYDPKFVQTGVDLAPLTMPLSKALQSFMFADLPEATYQRLPAMLADALPDAFGNALIDAWMANHGVRKENIRTLDRLAYMGSRGMGALTFNPTRGPNRKPASAVEMAGLVNAARLAVHGGVDNDAHAAAVLKQIIQVGTSAGGARAKATIAWNPTSNEVRTGQFDIPEGFEAWLLKFDGIGLDTDLGPSQQYGRIEYAYALMARAAGIHMSDCRLLEENGRAHFMTRRFDRTNNQRHHMQSLCAMAHLDYKQKATHSYNQLLSTVDALKLGKAAMVETFRRMVFNVLAANCDDHTKNFAFLLPEGGHWQLSPAYDVTHAYNPTGEWTYQHLMSVNGKFSGITQADFKAVADRFDLLAHVNEVVEQVSTSLAHWAVYAKQAGVDALETKRISTQLADVSAAYFNRV